MRKRLCPARSDRTSAHRRNPAPLFLPPPSVGEGCAALASLFGELRRSWVRGRERSEHLSLPSATRPPRIPAALVAPTGQPYLEPMTGTPEIALTPAAAARVAAIAERQGKPAILRLAVDGGGCAGFTYRFGLADEIEADDLAAVEGGVTLVVDPMTLDLVRGGAVDYVESLGGAAFQEIGRAHV